MRTCYFVYLCSLLLLKGVEVWAFTILGRSPGRIPDFHYEAPDLCCKGLIIIDLGPYLSTGNYKIKILLTPLLSMPSNTKSKWLRFVLLHLFSGPNKLLYGASGVPFPEDETRQLQTFKKQQFPSPYAKEKPVPFTQLPGKGKGAERVAAFWTKCSLESAQDRSEYSHVWSVCKSCLLQKSECLKITVIYAIFKCKPLYKMKSHTLYKTIMLHNLVPLHDFCSGRAL